MINLDDYLSTPNELFNTNVQYWYFEFTGSKKPNTEKTFEVFVKALHEVYFYIQENPNKPFACIEKIKNISKTSGFNELEKLILVDKILGILSHHPNEDNMVKVYLQITSYRDDLSPYLNDPEIINHKWHFDFEAIKNELTTIEVPTEKHKFLMNLLFDYSAKVYEIDELEHQYYKSIGFIQWIKTELSRCRYVQKLEKATTTAITKQAFQLRKKQGAKTDLIRILNAVYELKMFEMTDGQIPSKEMFMKQAGEFFGTDLSKYDIDLSQALNNTSLEANLKVFEQMKEVTQNSHYIGKKEK